MPYYSRYKSTQLEAVNSEHDFFSIDEIRQLVGKNYIIEKLLNFEGQRTLYNIVFNVDLMNSFSRFNIQATKMLLRGKIKPQRLYHIACIEMRLKSIKYFEKNAHLDYICGNALILKDEEIINI